MGVASSLFGTMSDANKSGSGSSSTPTSTVIGSSSSSSRSRDWRPITSTLLNGKNYVLWAKAVEVYYLGESERSYLTDDPPAVSSSTYAAW